MIKAPDNWKPYCKCYQLALEPNEDCPIHGWPNPWQCLYCGQFKKHDAPCKRCGWAGKA